MNVDRSTKTKQKNTKKLALKDYIISHVTCLMSPWTCLAYFLSYIHVGTVIMLKSLEAMKQQQKKTFEKS